MKIFICSLFALFLFGITSAQTNTWTGGNNSWNTGGNWSLGVVPTAAHDVVINTSSSISIDVTPPNLSSLTITNNSSVIFTCNNSGTGKTITISNSGTGFSINNGSSLSLVGAGGGRTMNIAFSAATTNSSILGTLILNATGGGSSYNATNSLTTVSGTITNNGGTITSNSGNLTFSSGGTYNHAINGGSIPTATWNSISNCNITGITNSVPTGLSQAFGNFTWNCIHAANANINLNSTLTNIQGNFTVLRAGRLGGGRVSDPLILSSNNSFTLNVGGNININTSTEATWLALTSGAATVIVNVAGNFNMSGSNSFFDFVIGSTMNSHIVNITGNLVISGGLFDWTYIPTAGANFATVNLNGNFSLSGTGAMITSVASTTIPNGKIRFVKPGIQTISISNPANLIYTNFEVNNNSTVEILNSFNLTSQGAPFSIKGGKFEVLSGGIVDMKTNQILSSSGTSLGLNNSFILNSGGGIITANANGVHQTLSASGSISPFIATRTFSSGANYTYDGTVIQNSGIFTTTPTVNTVNNLTINNSSGIAATGVTLQQNFNVNGTLNLQLGHFTTFLDRLITLNASAALIGGSDNSFVNGPMRKVGNTAFTFPVGKLIVSNSNNPTGYAGGWRPIGIFDATGSSVTDSYTAEYFISNANLIGPVTSLGLYKVSPCEYWGLKRDAINTNSDVSVTLHWKPKSGCNPGAYILDPQGVTAALNSTGVPLVSGSGPWDNHNGIGFGTPTDGYVIFPFVPSALMSSFTGATYGEFTPFAIASTNRNEAPLPFELKVFNAKPKDQSVTLDWLVNKNELVKKFTIERSKDGYHFESLKTVNPVIGVQSASYNDKDLLPFSGWSYYRLRITNHDDIDVFSSVQKVWVGKSGSWLQVSPKPAKDNLLVNLAAPERITELSIINSMGQVMFKLTRLQSMNQLDISRLKPGIYYVRVIGVDGSFTDNFIKQ